ncbi:MAG: DUF2852 domain-containing protein [Pseudolabrys sp.]|nr:DUF2852 domain-containing protein [Pseudolabrys sp.]
MPITAKLDEYGKPAWIALIVLGFWVFWPLGLAILIFTIWSGRMGCGYHASYGDYERWQQHWQHKMERLQRKLDWMRSRISGDSSGGGMWRGPSSGNRAFDEYRAETLRRLEEEQREFREFLDRLRMAKDKAEFDQFMAERRRRQGPETPQPSAQG